MNLSKYIALSILIIIFVFDLSFAEDTQYGFQDIPFGTSYEEVKQKLEATYIKMHHTYRFGKGFSGKDYISFNHFDLGDNQIEVRATFEFDHNEKFYSFYFSGSNYTYLENIFKNKYGEPSKCYGISIHVCEWNHKDLDISTGLVTGFPEGATARVASKKLKKEYNSYKKQQENKSTNDGAKKF